MIVRTLDINWRYTLQSLQRYSRYTLRVTIVTEFSTNLSLHIYTSPHFLIISLHVTRYALQSLRGTEFINNLSSHIGIYSAEGGSFSHFHIIKSAHQPFNLISFKRNFPHQINGFIIYQNIVFNSDADAFFLYVKAWFAGQNHSFFQCHSA